MTEEELENKTIIHFAPVINIEVQKLGDEERAWVNIITKDILRLLDKFADRELEDDAT